MQTPINNSNVASKLKFKTYIQKQKSFFAKIFKMKTLTVKMKKCVIFFNNLSHLVQNCKEKIIT